MAFLDPLPPGFNPSQWLEDADARVRREALRVAHRLNRLRPRAIGQALDDQDPTMITLGLNAALGRVRPRSCLASSRWPASPDSGRTAGAVGESPRAWRRRTRSPRVVAAHYRRRDVLLKLARAAAHDADAARCARWAGAPLAT